MSSPEALVSFDWQPTPANGNEQGPRSGAGLSAESATVEPVVSAAVLVATAFRLRDEDGLIETLRLLTAAVSAFEARHQPEAAAA